MMDIHVPNNRSSRGRRSFLPHGVDHPQNDPAGIACRNITHVIDGHKGVSLCFFNAQ